MLTYLFRLESFQAIKTRSQFGGDTDTATFTLQVGDHIYDPSITHLGNVNSGDGFGLGLGYDSIPIAMPDTPIRMNYIIMNGGAYDNALRNVSLAAIGSTYGVGLLGTALVPPDPGIVLAVAPVWLLALSGGIASIAAFENSLGAALGTNCDGVVVADQIEVTRQELDEQLASHGGVYRETRSYPADTSHSIPTFCQKSLYTVTWLVQLIPDKTKESKEGKENPETKSPSKDHKELKDDRGDALERADAPTGVVERLSQIDAGGQEEPSASGRAFIRAIERPQVGEQALRPPSE